MKRKSGNKNVMSLSRKECLIVHKEFLINAEAKYKDAITLANISSYGSATSHLIISMEETMKAIVVYLDGNGFEFRMRVKGIKGLFENHQLRYFLAIALSVLNIFVQDFILLIERIKKDKNVILNIKFDDADFQKQINYYIIEKTKSIMNEVVWFSNADIYRQDGFYVDYSDEIKTPLSISNDEFLEIKTRVDNLRNVASNFLQSFVPEEADLKDHIKKFKKQLIEEKWYEQLSKLIEKTKDRKNDPFELMIKSLSELESDMKQDQVASLPGK